ncbi:MAG: transposase [Victivallales bacterium]|nr:transposase [Victivallales bacterium]
MRRRRRAEAVDRRNDVVVQKIKEIKGEHPFWGYRRIGAYLRYVEGEVVNRKRVLRLMREHDLKQPYKNIRVKTFDTQSPRTNRSPKKIKLNGAGGLGPATEARRGRRRRLCPTARATPCDGLPPPDRRRAGKSVTFAALGVGHD